MSFLLEIAIKRYDRSFDLKHAGYLSYADDQGVVRARADQAGPDGKIEPLDSREAKKAAERKKSRGRGKKKLSGRVIDGRAYRVR